ncbi:MAG: NADH-ubiquinone oxidoreductase-F iron-sulfur binding region domain-containing protein [Sedimentisphaerales bacterium]|jgi:NADH:ubiquinone oxidoreductase subunit F (NADH-binding)/NAD-dependent dihydropyrimidine dehydrogenase PreA subunit/(2Fe-2S) ferredoxin
MSELKHVDDLKILSDRLKQKQEGFKTIITICGGTGCRASGARAVIEALDRELRDKGLSKKVRVVVTGCHGFCEQGPIMVIEPGNTFYCHLKPQDVPEIISETIQAGNVVERLLYVDPVSGRKIGMEKDIPFYRDQNRILLAWNKKLNPGSIEDYIALGGYMSLARVLAQNAPQAVIVEITASGLRGRGGGGFPTGRKWSMCRAAASDEKYVICNADEGDPGAYMDRSILEGNPHLVLEGMLIGAWAVGAQKGYVYVRNEYPLAVEHIRLAVEQARGLGLLGEHILGSEFCFDIEIARGGGAFVCGESTALMASIEGKVGEPRPKDVHTVEEGLWNKPTCLNNVETWANVPLIISRGADWFEAQGTEGSKGTKIFALTGKVKNTGLVEVPFGTSLKTIIYDIGGGAPDGVEVKAVQTGGPSGGCLPVEKFDLPVDFDTLGQAGSMVGSGGMVVMDQRTCMVDVAKYFLTFLQDESCGKCVPCRIGIDRMLEIVTDISEGRGEPEQLKLLEELAQTVCETSLCALGKTAPNPVLSTLRYFRDEYEAHIEQKRCPAGVCRRIIRYSIHPDKCTGCGLCLGSCPHGAITGERKQPHVIDLQLCRRCGLCLDACKQNAIEVA